MTTFTAEFEKQITGVGDPASAWVREVLEPDQLSAAKFRLGRRALGGKTTLLLWGLRIYVGLMVILIVWQIWNALRAGN